VTGGRPKNLLIILAREFAANLATPMTVVDADGTTVYFNEPAERVLGQTYAEAGELSAAEWESLYTVERLDGTPLPLAEMPAGVALFERRPAHETFRITGLDGRRRRISATAFPLLAHPEDIVGAVAIFWEAEAEDA
jgi:PAS domain-containing protein